LTGGKAVDRIEFFRWSEEVAFSGNCTVLLICIKVENLSQKYRVTKMVSIPQPPIIFIADASNFNVY